MPEITTDEKSFESIDYPKSIYELLLAMQNQPLQINCNCGTSSAANTPTIQQKRFSFTLDDGSFSGQNTFGINLSDFQINNYDFVNNNLLFATALCSDSSGSGMLGRTDLTSEKVDLSWNTDVPQNLLATINKDLTNFETIHIDLYYLSFEVPTVIR